MSSTDVSEAGAAMRDEHQENSSRRQTGDVPDADATEKVRSVGIVPAVPSTENAAGAEAGARLSISGHPYGTSQRPDEGAPMMALEEGPSARSVEATPGAGGEAPLPLLQPERLASEAAPPAAPTETHRGSTTGDTAPRYLTGNRAPLTPASGSAVSASSPAVFVTDATGDTATVVAVSTKSILAEIMKMRLVRPFRLNPSVDWTKCSLRTTCLGLFYEDSDMQAAFLEFNHRTMTAAILALLSGVSSIIVVSLDLAATGKLWVVHVIGGVILIVIGLVIVATMAFDPWVPWRTAAYTRTALNLTVGIVAILTSSWTVFYMQSHCAQTFDSYWSLPTDDAVLQLGSRACVLGIDSVGVLLPALGVPGLSLHPVAAVLLCTVHFCALIAGRALEWDRREPTMTIIAKAIIHAAIGAMAITVSILRYRATQRAFETTVAVERATAEGSRRSDELEMLLATLVPASVLDRLAEHCEAATKAAKARARRVNGRLSVVQRGLDLPTIEVDFIPEATMLFADMAGFTRWSSTKRPKFVASMLNTVVAEIDRLAWDDEAIEKVKTVGDAYWAVAGVPDAHPEHADRLAAFAFRVQSTVAVLNQRHPEWGTVLWRIGLHSGPMRAALFGTQQVSYEVFGSTCRVCQLVEAASVSGGVCITKEVLTAMISPPAPALLQAHGTVAYHGVTYELFEVLLTDNSGGEVVAADNISQHAGGAGLRRGNGVLVPPESGVARVGSSGGNSGGGFLRVESVAASSMSPSATPRARSRPPSRQSASARVSASSGNVSSTSLGQTHVPPAPGAPVGAVPSTGAAPAGPGPLGRRLGGPAAALGGAGGGHRNFKAFIKRRVAERREAELRRQREQEKAEREAAALANGCVADGGAGAVGHDDEECEEEGAAQGSESGSGHGGVEVGGHPSEDSELGSTEGDTEGSLGQSNSNSDSHNSSQNRGEGGGSVGGGSDATPQRHAHHRRRRRQHQHTPPPEVVHGPGADVLEAHGIGEAAASPPAVRAGSTATNHTVALRHRGSTQAPPAGSGRGRVGSQEPSGSPEGSNAGSIGGAQQLSSPASMQSSDRTPLPSSTITGASVLGPTVSGMHSSPGLGGGGPGTDSHHTPASHPEGKAAALATQRVLTVDEICGSDEDELTPGELEARIGLQRWILPHFVHPKVELRFDKFAAVHQRHIIQGVGLAVAACHGAVLVSFFVQEGLVARIVSIVLSVMAVGASLGAFFATTFMTSSRISQVGSVLALFVGATCGILSAGLAAESSTPSFTDSQRIASGGIEVTYYAYFALAAVAMCVGPVSWPIMIILVVLLIGAPMVVFQYRRPYGGSGLFGGLAGMLFGGVMLYVHEALLRRQFLEKTVANRIERRLLGAKDEREAILGTAVPAHAVPGLMEWLAADMDPAAAMADEFYAVVVFIQLNAPRAPPGATAATTGPLAEMAAAGAGTPTRQARISGPPPPVADANAPAATDHAGDIPGSVPPDADSALAQPPLALSTPRLPNSAPTAPAPGSPVPPGSDGYELSEGHWLPATHAAVDAHLSQLQKVVKIKTIGDTVLLAGPFDSRPAAAADTDAGRNGESRATKPGNGHGAGGGGAVKEGSLRPTPHGRGQGQGLRSAADHAVAAVALLAGDASLRAGLHVGQVTGTVQGISRLCFDIFGDTVNVASRIMTGTAVDGPLPPQLSAIDGGSPVGAHSQGTAFDSPTGRAAADGLPASGTAPLTPGLGQQGGTAFAPPLATAAAPGASGATGGSTAGGSVMLASAAQCNVAASMPFAALYDSAATGLRSLVSRGARFNGEPVTREAKGKGKISVRLAAELPTPTAVEESLSLERRRQRASKARLARRGQRRGTSGAGGPGGGGGARKPGGAGAAEGGGARGGDRRRDGSRRR